ncbi:MAG: MarR family winged helix-turn-helix transcriptional regulator [Gammaproteobacteria bacterium]|jgi:DNA-binding MarR family transcriptional regulator|nr:MarR family winged helix-turn-helix transcriptional regulator [Gammaproteobacteria bacterium]MBU0828643.1 MarR family winged helix-turn-helix transcriptional regulator [Gammaproteobacteria bacterium]MBU0891161.1 MarR family winged helix-turn-helix transcriptional regulator [Gammaproteobacteria bacterium]MBU1354024.1 MarR family winged helix-turn-helix transcriptional regulator [Gammaproteobacteria bacterium]MBU1506429.1 MarR family winged helix-turn-helix transcriptional regulator [Gammaprot
MTSKHDSPAAPGFYNAEHYDPDKLVPENSVGYLMRKVMSSIRTQADAQLASHDLTYAQWLPLFKLSLSSTATVASLARDLETDPASTTRSLDRMEAKGLVVRERSTVDRRVVQLKLTPEGQRIAALVPPVLADVLNVHLSDFTHDEWQLLLSMLRRMLVNGKPPGPSSPPSGSSVSSP